MKEQTMSDEVIKTCTCCQKKMTASEIVDDTAVRPIGMAFYEDKDANTHFYFFQHEIPECGTSFVVDVEHFKQFVSEPIPEAVLRGKPGCEGHCVNIQDLNDCRQECHFAPFRRFLLKMLVDKKAKLQHASAL
jgi:hypothetical protein